MRHNDAWREAGLSPFIMPDYLATCRSPSVRKGRSLSSLCLDDLTTPPPSPFGNTPCDASTRERAPFWSISVERPLSRAWASALSSYPHRKFPETGVASLSSALALNCASSLRSPGFWKSFKYTQQRRRRPPTASGHREGNSPAAAKNRAVARKRSILDRSCADFSVA